MAILMPNVSLVQKYKIRVLHKINGRDWYKLSKTESSGSGGKALRHVDGGLEEVRENENKRQHAFFP